jgi:hypothetical protein
MSEEKVEVAGLRQADLLGEPPERDTPWAMSRRNLERRENS